MFVGHGTPGSRLDRYAALDDPEWVSRRRVRFIGVDRPGYGYSDPWPEANLLDCAGDFVRQGAVGWVDDVLRLGRPWPFRLDEIGAEVSFHHGEDDTNVPAQHAKDLAEGIPGSRPRLYPGEGHISIASRELRQAPRQFYWPGTVFREHRTKPEFPCVCGLVISHQASPGGVLNS